MKLARTAALCLYLLASGCCGPDRQRIEADRATYNWFAPLFAAYVIADPALDAQVKAMYERGLRAWKERIDADALAVGVR